MRSIIVTLCILLSACAHIPPPPDDTDSLDVEQMRLSDLAAQFNRRNARQVTLDRSAGKLDPEGLVLAAQELYPNLKAEETAEGWSVKTIH